MNVIDYIRRYAKQSPDVIALEDKNGSISYKELIVYIESYSKYIAMNICKPKTVVLLCIKNKRKWVLTFLSLLYLDCWVVPISDELTESEIVEIKMITHAICSIGVEDIIGAEYLGMKLNVELYQTQGIGGILHMTSGSTGHPKFCIRTIESLTEEGLIYKNSFAISQNDKILGVPPFFHSYALGAACMASLISGANLYMADRFVPREILEIAEKNKITIMILVADMVRIIASTYIPYDINLAHIRITLVGAGAITQEVYNYFLNKFHITLLSNYGSTETGGVISRLDNEPYNAIGKPMVGVSYKILNASSREEIGEATEQEGELCIKSKGMFTGYLDDSNNLNQEPINVLDEEGFYSTGDIVRRDAKGMIYVVTRKKNIISVGGKKVNPLEVEKVLLQIPEIKECYVLGISTKEGREAVKAFIVGGDIKEEQIRNFCKVRLAAYKVPSIITFIDKLPRNALGKIKRMALQEDNDEKE